MIVELFDIYITKSVPNPNLIKIEGKCKIVWFDNDNMTDIMTH